MKLARFTKEGAWAFLSILLLLGILVLLQYLLVRHAKEWDFTRNKRYSLSPLSRKISGELKKELQIWVFSLPSDTQTKDLVHEYLVSSPEISAHYVNPVSEPIQARKFGITSPPPVLVLLYGNKQEQINQPDEQHITNAIHHLISGKERMVYFLEGDGESDSDSGDSAGLSGFSHALQQENFKVETFAFLQEKNIPEDASCLVIANPRHTLPAPEKQRLIHYLQQGGHLLFLCGIETPESWTRFLNAFGLRIGNNFVIDPKLRFLGAGPEFLVTNSYSFHPITQPLLTKKFPDPLLLPLVRSVDPVQAAPKAIQLSPLVTTTPWGQEVPLKRQGKKWVANPKNSQKQIPRKIPVAITVTRKNKKGEEGRMVVMGSALFAENNWLTLSANQDFLLNAVSWLSQSENTLAIPPRTAADSPFIMEASAVSRLFLISVILIPAFGVLTGIQNWIRRRYR